VIPKGTPEALFRSQIRGKSGRLPPLSPESGKFIQRKRKQRPKKGGGPAEIEVRQDAITIKDYCTIHTTSGFPG
jgi:hypothetical protein